MRLVSLAAMLLSMAATTSVALGRDDACEASAGASRNAKAVRVSQRTRSDEPRVRGDILETAAASGQFLTLINAAAAAGLIDTLQDDDDITVLAPTDEAFAKLPKGTLANLLKPENRKALRDILTYHVLRGRQTAASLKRQPTIGTANGAKLTIASNAKGLAINESTLIQADLRCENGLIHVIDRVLLPPAPGILVTAERAGTFSTLLTAIKAAGLTDALQGDGPFTVFAPTDEAFAKLPKGTLEKLLDSHNRDALAAILKLHVVPGVYKASVLRSRESVQPLLEDKALKIQSEGASLKINGVSVVKADIEAGNGIIHVIDEVLLPNKTGSSVLDVAESRGKFNVLLAAIRAAGLEEALEGEGPFTILAPTDAAFSKIPPEKLKALLQPANRDALTTILKYHVIKGTRSASDLVGQGRSSTLLGSKKVVVGIDEGRVVINKANVIATDIKASNGLIHAIDTVLMPE